MTGRGRYADCTREILADRAGVAGSDGAGIAYLVPRLPPAAPVAVLAWHRVLPGDRLDLLAARYLGDPAAAWRICDANLALDPDELVGPAAADRTLLVPVPQPGG